jgi:hypothetical protein
MIMKTYVHQKSADRKNLFLLVAATVTFIIALLHAGMIFVGAPAYDFFRAGPEMTEMALNGSIIPALVTSGVILFLLLFAGYALSGSGLIRPFPLLKWVLPAIGILFLLRGSVLILQIPGHFPESEMRDIVFSVVALLIGLCYLFGWRARQRQN